MSVPKRKMSRTRTKHRKAQWLGIKPPTQSSCKRCKQPLRPHTVCKSCGVYGGKVRIDVD